MATSPTLVPPLNTAFSMPKPSCPLSLRPHANTRLPQLVDAKTWDSPAATCQMSSFSRAFTGSKRCCSTIPPATIASVSSEGHASPLPSWPYWLRPDVKMRPCPVGPSGRGDPSKAPTVSGSPRQGDTVGGKGQGEHSSERYLADVAVAEVPVGVSKRDGGLEKRCYWGSFHVASVIGTAGSGRRPRHGPSGKAATGFEGGLRRRRRQPAATGPDLIGVHGKPVVQVSSSRRHCRGNRRHTGA